MKKLTFFFILFFALFSSSLAQQYGWIVINPESISGTPDFSDVSFTDANTGWITSSSQANIYKTNDGGASFSTQSTQYATNAINMIDDQEGYVGGENGRIYRTTDCGVNWITVGSIGVTLLDISHPLSGDTGYACGGSGHVHSFTSSGETNLNSGLSPLAIRGISAPSVNNVWVCGGNRIYYYNGTNFTSQIAPSGTFNDIHFINKQEGWVVGNSGVIGHTTDGGAGWATQTNPDTQNRSLYGVFFYDSDNGWAVGNGGIILHTTNGGTIWTVEAAGLTTAFLSGAHFTSTTNGYVVGNNKTLLKYSQVSGIGDQNLSLEFSVFPNPAKDKLQVIGSEFTTKNCTIEIHDLNGKTLIEKQIAKGRDVAVIDVSKLASGVYFCKVKTDKKSMTKKIIIE